ncbi:bifunctional 3-(3-hydroxy-phenyl)propionate/3-hydroxycinnamic acid hydroxylase [Amycolatopsis pithecellobii]|uniref:Bifunctional 3-(3-hydroxy-phenyl)propionate/3-hydroxycinnamic acid hydroxylase n=1 Tax=Amycolatopsis pithecellobii TaxID=664692 RepID=A0A6N7ZB11_9PSEU|nr:bifunctional 3-(3-hydroxy-phenyl)propionate/3-hydroxycinnamic acid hydroxylase [Amycolatopsis pithecellobii]MTD58899.1 bifunctional 3-(3-hydroxy-phenyl)propionate/3-hydroxycinnamic acid hydroxylase [Amycolatopsis pithecellobii]
MSNDAGSRVFEADVLVIGYGPVGMTAAALLAQQGFDVLAIEKHPRLFGLPRAGHLDGETLRTFQGLGIGEQVEIAARAIADFRLVDAQRKPLTSRYLGEDGHGWKPDYISFQPEIETLIDGAARGFGARVVMGLEATGLAQDADGVTVTARHREEPDAEPVVIRTRYVLGADGAGSFVRRALEIELDDLGLFPNPHLVLDIEQLDPDRDLESLPEVAQVLDPARPVLAGRWNGARWSRWEYTALEGESRESLEREDFAWGLLAEWGVTPADAIIIRRAVYDFRSTVAKQWRRDRVLLLGDAAHTQPPFMGQGMLSGIRDAVNLSWKLAAVLRGQADGSLLDTYQTERAPHVLDLTRRSIATGQLVTMTDPVAASARDEAIRAGTMPPPAIFPRLGAGIVTPAGAPAAIEALGGDGRPGLQARVVNAGVVRKLDDVVERGWRIVSRHRVDRAIFTPAQRRLLDRLGMRFVHVTRGTADGALIDLDGDYDLWFRGNGRKAYLARPDHYVFGTAEKIDDLPALVDELAGSLAAAGWRTNTPPFTEE